jgi:glycosyltransferase involved in cell wall biosynthesis
MDAAPVTTVISCFNVASRVDSLIAAMDTMHANGAAHWRFLLVDDGSTDATFPLLVNATRSREWLEILRHRERRGFGVSLRTGLARSDSPVVCTFDAGHEARLDGLLDLVAMIEQGAEIVSGCTGPIDAGSRATSSWATRSRDRLSGLYEKLVGYDLDTLISPLRAYRRATLEHLRCRAKGSAANAEILLRALAGGVEIRVVRVPGGSVSRAPWGPKLQASMTRYLLLAAAVPLRMRSRRARLTTGDGAMR